MDTYHEIKMQVKTQLKGHFLFLYGWLLFVSLLIALIQNVGGFLGNGLGATLLSLALSLLCVVVNNTMLFLFIQRVRSLRFRKQDIRYSFSKAGEQIVIGLCLSLLQLFLQIVVSVCAFLPILYMLVSAFLSLFFVYWYACIAWLIYDQDTHIKDLFIKPLHIMKVQASALFWAGGFYVLWNILSQIGLSMVLKPFIKESDSLEQALLTLVQQGADHMETIWLLLAFCIVYFLVQYVILVVLYTFLANVYEMSRERS